MNLHAMDRLIRYPCISRGNLPAEAIIGLARHNENIVAALHQIFANWGDDKVFGIVILANDQNPHSDIIAQGEFAVLSRYNEVTC